MTLPSQQQFLKMVQEIRRVPFGPGLASAELVEFLAYTGLRVKSEAAHVNWADCDFERGEIVVRGAPETGTKNSDPRRVPMIPDCRRLCDAVWRGRKSWQHVRRIAWRSVCRSKSAFAHPVATPSPADARRCG